MNLDIAHQLAIFKRGTDELIVEAELVAKLERGKPTGRNLTRPPLTTDELAANAKTYTDQVFLILDRDQTEVAFNSTWLAELGADGMIRLAAKYTVARMLERDDFAKRYREGQ